MRRALLVGLAVAGLALAGIAAAHVNDVEADPQVSVDGEVVVESGLLLDPGYAVLHLANETGDPGEVIGHVPIEGSEYYGTLSIPVDDAVWADWNGSRRVWVALHREVSGPGGFDPGEDPIFSGGFAGLAAEEITLRKADADWRVLAERFEAEPTDDTTVSVRQVVLGAPGTLVVRTHSGDEPGRVVGSRSLSAGVHEEVAVELHRAAFVTDNRTVELFAALYGPNGTTPVTAGEDVVGSVFSVRPADPLKRPVTTTTTASDTTTTGSSGTRTPTTASPGSTPVPTTTTDRPLVVTPTTTERPLVVTPTPTTATATSDGSGERTTSETAASSSATENLSTSTVAGGEGASGGGTTADGTGPGFGAAATLVAVLALAVLARRV